MVDIIDWIQTNGIGLLVIFVAPLVILGLYIALTYGSTLLAQPLNHISPNAYCATIPQGTYTIFPGFLVLLGLGGNSAYSSLYLLTACIGKGVSFLSVIIWWLELVPIGLIVEIIRERVQGGI